MGTILVRSHRVCLSQFYAQRDIMRETGSALSYVCQNCGHRTVKWLGRCPHCGTWNSLIEEAPRSAARRESIVGAGETQRLGDSRQGVPERTVTGIGEFDGGGIVPGSLILIGGEPGIGKSTLMLQVAAALSRRGERVLYVSAEESLSQMRMRAERIGAQGDGLFVLCEADVTVILEEARKLKASVVVIDSMQVMYHPDVPSTPGSVNQVRQSASALMALAKAEAVSVFIVGHVTKSGDIAGPRMLEHMVDTVLYFEGGRHHEYRILRTQKNRFGSTEEIGVFCMGPDGLSEVGDPSRLFLRERRAGSAGCVVTSSLEGTRPILVELQALVGERSFGIPQRRGLGVDYNRLCMLLAVLERWTGLKLRERDVFVSVAGGMTVMEPAVDLAIALALASSMAERPIDGEMVALGEIGLGGELRACHLIERRLREAGKLGFKKAVVPRSGAGGNAKRLGLELIPCETVGEAVKRVVSG
jgi:DNA repair protein RadA/Sms